MGSFLLALTLAWPALGGPGDSEGSTTEAELAKPGETVTHTFPLHPEGRILASARLRSARSLPATLRLRKHRLRIESVEPQVTERHPEGQPSRRTFSFLIQGTLDDEQIAFRVGAAHRLGEPLELRPPSTLVVARRVEPATPEQVAQGIDRFRHLEYITIRNMAFEHQTLEWDFIEFVWVYLVEEESERPED